MKSSALSRALQFLGLWLLFVLPAHAGSINSVFVPDIGDPKDPADDLLVQKSLQWYPGANVTFYYISNSDGTIFLNTNGQFTVPHVKDPDDIRMAFSRAIARWNKAKYAGGP